MKNTKNWFKRSLAMLLVVVTLVGLVPANAIAAGADNSYIPGDVNSDGKVNAKDVNLTRRYIVGGYDVTIKTVAADVNADGNIDAKDITNMRRYIDYLEAHSEFGLVTSDKPGEWCLGDWCTPVSVVLPAPFVNNYFYL